MSNTQDLFGTLRSFDLGNGAQGALHSLPQLERAGLGQVSRLPVSIRLVLESVLRNCDGKRVLEENVRALANWKPSAPRKEEIPFVVARKKAKVLTLTFRYAESLTGGVLFTPRFTIVPAAKGQCTCLSFPKRLSSSMIAPG